MDVGKRLVHSVPMTGSIEHLILAVATFLASHFILSSIPVRTAVISRVGDKPFQGVYALVSLAAFVWMVMAYKTAPVHDVWQPIPQMATMVMPLMLIACVFFVAAYTTKSPTNVGAESYIADMKPAQGIQSITRHPFLWAVVLWAISHLLVNGDMATIILMLGMITLSFGGMRHIDYRRAKLLGSAWGPVALTTSVTPFKAVLQGRCKLDLKGIGLLRVLGGVLIYAGLLIAHKWIAGVQLINIEIIN